jgi:hypothetical protein
MEMGRFMELLKICLSLFSVIHKRYKSKFNFYAGRHVKVEHESRNSEFV